MAQALYGKIVESQTFSTQAEAIDWAKEKKAKYKAAGESVKHEIIPTDATRRRWKATLYLKV